MRWGWQDACPIFSNWSGIVLITVWPFALLTLPRQCGRLFGPTERAVEPGQIG